MDSIEKLTDLFKKFPTVGSRTAGRFVYYLMRLPKERVDEIINAIADLKNKTRLCQLCFNPYEEPLGRPTSAQLCAICSDPRRDKNLLCIVEKEADLLAIENIPNTSRTHGEVGAKKFNGLYFILGGTVAVMKKDDISQLRIEELKKRVAENKFSEIIVALNPTPEGRTTSVLVENTIKEAIPSAGASTELSRMSSGQVPKITHLAKGIPVGGELEYADEETLESALEGRK